MLPCSSLSPGICSDSCPWSWWCYLSISSSSGPFFCHLSVPASRSFPMSQLFASGGQSIGALASSSVLPMNNQDLFPLGLTGLNPLQSKGLSRVFSSTTVQKHQFFSSEPCLSIQDYWKNISHGHLHTYHCPLQFFNSDAEVRGYAFKQKFYWTMNLDVFHG